jgi:hypothetical protein
MNDEAVDAPAVPCEPEIDENGVDLAQIRAMLELTPEQRLRRMTSFLNSLLAVRDLDENRRSG